MAQQPFDPSISFDEVPAGVEKQLSRFFAEQEPVVAEIGAPVEAAVDYLKNFVLGGGKRIRPLFGWAGYIGAGGLNKRLEEPEAVFRTLCSLEFIQACALVHDDIIDASDTRRGNPTVHRAIEANHLKKHWRGDAATFGRNAAILIGDLALVWAEDMWRYSGVSEAGLQRAASAWRGMRTEVIGGQLLDISLEAQGSESIELANKVNTYKTAAYTIARPLHLGAMLADAPAATVDAFRGYGHDIGIAYQLRDDLLGVFGEPEVTGKPAGDDIREGKRTVLFATALAELDTSNPAAAERLRERIGVASDPEELRELAELIRRSGAEEAVEREIDARTTSGLKHLADAGIDDDVASFMHDLAIRATARRM